MPTHFLPYFALGASGALAAELLNLYELRGKLASAKYRHIAGSPLFWAVCAGMLLASGFIAWAVNSAVDAATPLQVILSGIGARGLARGAAGTTVANAPDKFGESGSVSLRDILA